MRLIVVDLNKYGALNGIQVLICNDDADVYCAGLNVSLIISGAFGVFRRSVVVEAGEYSTSRTSRATVGEDMELVVRLHLYCCENKKP